MTKPGVVKKFAGWRQSTPRAWMWIAIMFMSLVSGLGLILNGQWQASIIHWFILWLVYWADQMEKEITRRNIEDEK